jgi:hypothetical protein
MLILLLACTGETLDPPDRVDLDEDGWVSTDDCDDEDPDIHPEAEESCNGLDDNCDGQIDEGVKTTIYQDADGDGYGDAAYAMGGCGDEPGWSTDPDDCDDSDLTIRPGAPETCNDVDDDCDGEIDEGAVDGLTSYADSDGDGYGDPYVSSTGCTIPSGYTGDRQDCDDDDAQVYPGAEEICDDGRKNNCKADDDQVREACSMWGDQPLSSGLADFGAVATFAGDHDGDGTQDLAHVDEGGLELILDPHDSWTTQTLGGTWDGLAGVGDVTGDGLDDLLAAGGATPTLWSSTSALTLGSSTGTAIPSSAGDLDGDGDLDLLVAWPLGSSISPEAGDTELYLGPITAAASPVGVISGQSASDRAGSALAHTDMNADGIEDLLLAAPGAALNGTGSGAVFILHGPITGSVDLADYDGALLGESEGDLAGTSMDARDGDGDGYGDVLVGAPGYDSGAGVAWISYGPFTGMEGLAGRSTSMTSTEAGTGLGQSVRLVDLDGDGKADPVIGSSGTVWMAYAKLEFAVWTTDESNVFFTSSEAEAGLGASLERGNLLEDDTEDLLLGGSSVAWLVQGSGR